MVIDWERERFVIEQRSAAAIANLFRQRIAEGVWPPGARVPSQGALAAELGVGRHVVRSALGRLSDQGLIERGQGRAARVRRHHVQFDLSERTRFSETVKRLGLRGEAELISFRRRRPPATVIKAIGLKQVQPIWTAMLLRRVDGRPFSLGSHYFAPGLAVSGYGDDDFRSITRILADNGHSDYRRRHTIVGARLPTAREAALLMMEQNQPVMMTTGCNVSARGKPLEVSETLFPSELIRFTISH